MPGLLFLCQDLLSKGVESANMKGFFMCWELELGSSVVSCMHIKWVLFLLLQLRPRVKFRLGLSRLEGRCLANVLQCKGWLSLYFQIEYGKCGIDR
jgi:hypothetical protein